MLWIILVITSFDGWRATDTGLFQSLNRRQVVVSDRGHIYIIHPDIKYVIHFDERGKRLADIGGPGNGPGEFVSSFNLFTDDGTLYVHDFWTGKVVCFDERGRFLKKLLPPEPFLRLIGLVHKSGHLKRGSLVRENGTLPVRPCSTTGSRPDRRQPLGPIVARLMNKPV